jgi:hypothetical protein
MQGRKLNRGSVIRRLLRWLVGATTLAFFTAEAAAEDRALVIGINSYPNLEARYNLEMASGDAVHFADFLKDTFDFKSEQIRILRDADATRDKIVDAFRRWLIDGTRPGDRAIFYFSGHGLRFRSGDGFARGLAPSDVRKGDADGQAEFENVVPTDLLTSLRRELRGRTVLFFVDSCFSGKIARSKEQGESIESGGVRAKSLTPDSIGLLRGVAEPAAPDSADNTEFALWAAVAPNQLAFEDPAAGGSVFTAALIRGVRERAADLNGDGKIQVAELLNFVSEASGVFCNKRRKICLNGLTPDLTAIPDDSYRTTVFWPRARAAEVSTGGDVAQATFQRRNDFDLKLEMQPSTSVQLNDNIFFRISSAASGQLMLFDQGSDGVFRMIFPNRPSIAQGMSRLIGAGSPIEIPRNGFRFRASPRGRGMMLALVVADDVRLEELTAAFENSASIDSPDKLIGAIASRLQKPILSGRPDVPDRLPRWAAVWQKYEVR